ncbi:hypothetical protein ACLK1Z_20135 [Escherichia coli]
MPDVELMQKTLGKMQTVTRKKRGSGNGLGGALGNSNGNLKLLMNDGLVSRNAWRLLG